MHRIDRVRSWETSLPQDGNPLQVCGLCGFCLPQPSDSSGFSVLRIGAQEPDEGSPIIAAALNRDAYSGIVGERLVIEPLHTQQGFSLGFCLLAVGCLDSCGGAGPRDEVQVI